MLVIIIVVVVIVIRTTTVIIINLPQKFGIESAEQHASTAENTHRRALQEAMVSLDSERCAF